MTTGDEICLYGKNCEFYGVVNYCDDKIIEFMIRKDGPMGTSLGSINAPRHATENDLLNHAEILLSNHPDY